MQALVRKETTAATVLPLAMLGRSSAVQIASTTETLLEKRLGVERKAPSKDPNALQMVLDSGGFFFWFLLSFATAIVIVAASTIGKNITIDIFMLSEGAAREDA